MRPVIFDFNGTLYSDTGFHVRAWKAFFAEQLGLNYTESQVHDICIGPSNEAILKRVCPGITDERVAELSAVKEEYYKAICRSKPENLRLIEGADEILAMLTERSVPFVLATSSPIGNVRFYLDDLELKKYFTMDRIVYEDGSVAHKPDPAFYTEAARRVNALPPECIVVEDSPTGVRGAMNAGVRDIVAIDRTMTLEQASEFKNIEYWIHDYWSFGPILEKLGCFE